MTTRAPQRVDRLDVNTIQRAIDDVEDRNPLLKQLNSDGTTGDGAFVRSESPTLVTPEIIGLPVDLVAANNLSDLASVPTARTNLGLGAGDSPQFTGVNIGHATDTTVTRSAAGDIAVEGNIVYRAGGTDVAVADGGTGSGTAAGARTTLGLAIGTDVAAYTSGAATSVTYDALNFTASAGTWTVDSADQVDYYYVMTKPLRMRVVAQISNTDVSSTPQSLQIKIPNSKIANRSAFGVVRYIDAGGTLSLGWCSVQSTATVINVQKASAANWTTTAADNTTVVVEIEFEIQP